MQTERTGREYLEQTISCLQVLGTDNGMLMVTVSGTAVVVA